MWYVVQVTTGSERATAELLERVVPAEVLDECFFPQYETEMKLRGRWVSCERPLFAGYIIAVTSDPAALARECAKIPQVSKLLTMGEQFVPLAAEERELIGAFTAKGRRVVPMSRAVKDGDRIVITSGPLKGREALIDRVDRKRSVAFIETELCGRKVAVRVGLSVVAAQDTVEGRALAGATRAVARARELDARAAQA